MEFKKMAQKFQKSFEDKLKNRPLFVVDLDKDELWDKYLSSFPEGTNPLYRERTEHDCSCCRHFIKEIGGTVYVDEELNVHSIFEFDTGSTTYQPVMDALSSYVKQHIAFKGLGSSTKIIGNIIEDKWFDPESFFNN